jgi:hypothetical protein
MRTEAYPEAAHAHRFLSGRAAWVGWTASANSTTSSLPKEFRVSSLSSMNAFCLASSSLRGMTSPCRPRPTDRAAAPRLFLIDLLRRQPELP